MPNWAWSDQMSLTKDQVKEFLSNLSVIELSNLVKELEQEWGVSAAAPVAVAAPCFENIDVANSKPN